MKTIIAVICSMLIATSVASAQEILALSYRESQEIKMSTSEKWTSDVEFYKNLIEAKNEVQNIWIREPRNMNDVVSAIGLFESGYAMGFFLHEMGHRVMANMTDSEIHWNKNIADYATNGWSYIDAPNKKSLQKVYSGGLFAQIVNTEVMFQNQQKGEFYAGVVVFNVWNSLTYVYKYERGQAKSWSDISHFKQYGGNVRALEAIVVSHAFYTAYRMYAGGEPLFNVSADTETGRLIISKDFKF